MLLKCNKKQKLYIPKNSFFNKKLPEKTGPYICYNIIIGERKMKSRGKILFVLMLIGILYFCFGLRTVEAKQLTTPLYFGINEIRTLSEPNMGYAIGNPNANGLETKGVKLWDILKYSTSTSNDPTEVDVYCMKAGVGFSNTYRRATYNFSFDMYKERDKIAPFRLLRLILRAGVSPHLHRGRRVRLCAAAGLLGRMSRSGGGIGRGFF